MSADLPPAASDPCSDRVAHLEREVGELNAQVARLVDQAARSESLRGIRATVRAATRRLVRTADVERVIQDVCDTLTSNVGFVTASVALLGDRARTALGSRAVDPSLPPGVVALGAAGFSPHDAELLGGMFRAGNLPPCALLALDGDGTIVLEEGEARCAECALHAHAASKVALARRIGLVGAPLGVAVVAVPALLANEAEAMELFDDLVEALGAAVERAAMAYEAAREQRRYREIFDASRDGLVLVTPQGRLIDCNDAFCALTGRSGAELRDLEQLSAITPPEATARELNVLRELHDSGRHASAPYEKDFIAPDGSRVPVEVNTYLARAENGDVDYLWGVVRDLRPRRAAEALAQRSEQNFRDFVESMNDVMIVIGDDDRVDYCNPVANRTLANGPQEHQRRDAVTLFVPEGRSEVEEALRSVRDLDQRRTLRTCLVGADGARIPVEFNAWAGSWDGRQCVLVVCEDLTAEEAALERFERVFRRNPNPMALQSAATSEFLDVNDAWVELTGYSRERALNTHYKALDLAVDREQQRAIAVELVRHGRVNDRPLQIRRYDGTARDGRFWGEVMEGPAGPEVLTVMVDVTERLAAERAAHETQQRYEQLLESTASYAWEVDPTGLYTFVSPTTESLLGRAPGEIAGKLNVLDLMPPADRERLAPLMPYVFTAGEPIVRVQNRVARADGTVLWVQTSGFPVYDGQGHIVAYRGIDTDITAQKLADDRLRESELLLSEAQAIANLGCWALNLVDNSLVWTEQTFRIFGLEPAAFAPDYAAFMRHVHPEDRDRVDQAFRTSLRERRGGYEIQHRIIRADDGTVRQVYERCIHERDPSGDIVRSVGIVQDITEQSAAADELRLLASQVEQAPFGIIRTDRDRLITWVNAAFTRLTGYTLEDAAGRSPGALLQGKATDPAARRRLKAALERVEPVNVEILNYRRDGSPCWVDLYVAPLHDRDGQHVGFVGFERDISERIEMLGALREATDDLERLNTELERRVAERTLEVHRQAAALVSSLEAVAMYAGDECIYRNPRHVELFGANLEVASWTALYCDRLTARLSDATGEHHAVGAHDATATRADGTQFDAEVEFTRLADGTTVVVTRDVSERRAAMRAIAVREARYRAVMEGAGDAIMTADAQGVLIEANPAAERLLGYTAAELAGRQIITIHPEGSRAEMAAIFAKMAIGAIDTAESVPMQRRDGSIVYVDVTGRLVPLSPDGAMVVGVFRDITARREAERELRELSDQLALSLKAGQIGRWSHDLKSGTIEWDDRMYELYGKSRQSFVPTFESWAALLSPSDRVSSAAGRRDAINRRGTWDSVIDIVTESGQRRTIRRMGMIVADEKGEPCRSIGIHYDITHIAERERALEALNHQLAAATRQKDEFLANMSHELRTPLNAILGMSEALEIGVYGKLDPKQLSSLRRIQDSGRHLLALINDLLDLAKIEAGKVVLATERVNTEEVVTSMISTMAETARLKGVTLRSQHDPDARHLRCDARRVRQILLNLLSNAIKFTEAGGTVTLRTSADLLRQRVEIDVIDTGEGIPADRLGQLFQPFVQLESTLTKRHGGTGLGLSIVKRLVELHGGGVSVTSEPGFGSTFSVWFPVEPGDIGPVRTSGSVRAVSETGSLPVVPDSSARILLVEDNDANVHVVRDFLESRGYSVTHAGDGAQAVHEALEQHYDLILMDVQMPVMDGLEATRRIRNLPAHRRTPIIALTSFAMPGDRDRCIAAGMSEYMAKPISLRALEQMIRNELERAIPPEPR